MMSPPRLRMTSQQYELLKGHLFPGDGLEAVAFGLCGRHLGPDGSVLFLHEVHPIPHSSCPVRSSTCVTWKTDGLEPLLISAASRGLSVVKFHSHPDGSSSFSQMDDESDHDLFKSVFGWLDDSGPHASVVMGPDGSMFGRAITEDDQFVPLAYVMIVGDDIQILSTGGYESVGEQAQRHAQLFGSRTASLLRDLKVGVVGCSGTGSFIAEMLARLGVRELVLVDPDRVEYRTLNRIIGTTAIDAALRRFKVEVLAEHVSRIGLGIQVRTSATQIADVNAVRALAGCDIVFGCMDSHDGRRTLNRLATFYLLPYFDCGVGLQADGRGGIDEVCAACHYVQPGKHSLAERGVIRHGYADAEALARDNPEMYQKLHAEKYIQGVKVDSPAVITVNALAASMVMNEFLARIHPFRGEPNSAFASTRFNLGEMYLDMEPGLDVPFLSRSIGRGDIEPLLNMSHLSTRPNQ